MKKWVSVLLAIWLMVSLCACGEDEDASKSPAEALANTTWTVDDNGNEYDDDYVLISGTEVRVIRLLSSGKMVYSTSRDGSLDNGWHGEWEVVDGKLYLFAAHNGRSYIFDVVDGDTLKSFDDHTLSKQSADKQDK